MAYYISLLLNISNIIRSDCTKIFKHIQRSDVIEKSLIDLQPVGTILLLVQPQENKLHDLNHVLKFEEGRNVTNNCFDFWQVFLLKLQDEVVGVHNKLVRAELWPLVLTALGSIIEKIQHIVQKECHFVHNRLRLLEASELPEQLHEGFFPIFRKCDQAIKFLIESLTAGNI